MTLIKPKLALLVAFLGLGVLPALSQAYGGTISTEQPWSTGERSAAVKKCKKKYHGAKRKSCLKKARKLPA